MIFMGNLTEELQSSRVFNYSELQYNKSQDHSRYLSIPKISRKDHVIFHQNVRGLNSNKLDELSTSLSASSSHIICLTEHNLCTNAIDIIVLAKYNLGAKFWRNTFKNGGVCIFIYKSIHFTNISLGIFCKEKDLEVCAVKLHLLSYEICIIAIYRSPSGNFQYFVYNLRKF
jgi:hypothetical protein